MFYENIGVPVRSSAKFFAISGLVLLLVGMGYSSYLYHKANAPSVPERTVRPEPSAGETERSRVPLASTSPSSWPKLVIPAGGRSELVPIPLNMRIVMDGDQFDLHTVYADGRDCSFRESGICPAGAYVGSYAVNKARETNVVSYAFAPMTR